MDWIINWFLKWVLEGLSSFFASTYEIGGVIFDDSTVKGFLDFWQSMGFIIFAISVIIGLFSLYEKAINNEQPNFYNFAKNLILSVFILYSTPLVKYVFTESMAILKLILKAINADYANAEMSFTLAPGGGTLLTVVLVIIVCIGGFVTFFGSLKRAGSIVIYAMCIYWYIPEVIRGNYNGLISWTKQVLGVLLTHVLQVSFFTMAIVKAQNMLATGDLNAGIPAMILFSTLSMIPQVISALFQTPSGNKGGALGMAMSAAQMGFFMMAGSKGGASSSTTEASATA